MYFLCILITFEESKEKHRNTNAILFIILQ